MVDVGSTGVLVGIWVTAVTSGVTINGATPLCFELAVEGAFPVSTAIVVLFCTTAFNLATLVMIFVPMSSAASTFNWAYATGCGVATLLLWVFFREKSKRYDFDASGVRPTVDNAASEKLRQDHKGMELSIGSLQTA